MSAASDDPAPAQRQGKAESAAAVRQITVSRNAIQSSDLFASAREISIVHGADTYRLRLTSQNKLILTK
jgi:hemin uptake protein HemP